MHRAISLLTLTVLVVVWASALADSLTGKVVKITDGDTLYVLDANYKEHKDPEFVTNVTASSDKRGQKSNRNTARVITG